MINSNSCNVTLNALRRYLRDRGCIEARVLQAADEEQMFIEFRCKMKRGQACRAVLLTDIRATELPTPALERVGRALAPCLGEGWHKQIPVEDPFA